MKRLDLTLAAAVLASACIGTASAAAQSAPELSLTRFDCGKTTTVADVSRFSDVAAFKGLSIQLTFSCYLIKHGSDYLVWDTGNPPATGSAPAPTAPSSSLVEQLAQLHLKPEQITFVGISHYHGDHVGQLASFPQATLLIGKGDWDAVNGPAPNPGVDPKNFAHWISGGGKVEPLLGDKGNVLVTGDLAHFRENYDSNGVPTFNTSRAETLASLDRFKQLAKNLNATVIIQHDARDIGKLPVFPASAK